MGLLLPDLPGGMPPADHPPPPAHVGRNERRVDVGLEQSGGRRQQLTRRRLGRLQLEIAGAGGLAAGTGAHRPPPGGRPSPETPARSSR